MSEAVKGEGQTLRFVRAALPGDAHAYTQIQIPNLVASLRAGTDEELPANLEQSFDAEAMEAQWLATLSRPAPPGHLVMTAVDTDTIVGFVTAGPQAPVASSAQMPAGGMEILALEVAADQVRCGHGSRLLAAVSDMATEEGVSHLSTWIVAGDRPRIDFFQGAGFQPAGARRYLDLAGVRITQHLWWAGLGAGEASTR